MGITNFDIVQADSFIDSDGNVIGGGDLALTQGSIFVGNASAVSAELDASGDAKIMIGNGTTITSVSVSGDISIDNAGLVALTSLDLETATVTNIATTELMIGTGAGTAAFAALSGDVTMTNGGVVSLAAEKKTDLLTLGLYGTVAAFGFPFNVVVDTAEAATFAKIDDGGSFANLADSAGEGGYTGAFQVWPDTELENDACYFGAAAPFGVLTMDVSATVATYGANSVQWEYYNGGWVPLTIIYDETDSTAQDGQRPFQVDGQIIFSAPTDWASTTIDGQAAFWVRAAIKAGFNVTQIPLLVDEHKLVTSPTASEMPAGGTIGRGRLSFTTPSGANNDTKIILCNLTKGTASAITTLTQALASNEVADFSVVCDAGDQIAWYITQEDGTTEYANGIAELIVVKD